MKQHVGVEQLKELNFEKQKKIATLFGQYGNCSRNDKDGNEYLNLAMLAERITIGKMIEVLASKHTIGMGVASKYRPDNVTIWEPLGSGVGKLPIDYYGKELADALWEAVEAMA